EAESHGDGANRRRLVAEGPADLDAFDLAPALRGGVADEDAPVALQVALGDGPAEVMQRMGGRSDRMRAQRHERRAAGIRRLAPGDGEIDFVLREHLLRPLEHRLENIDARLGTLLREFTDACEQAPP